MALSAGLVAVTVAIIACALGGNLVALPKYLLILMQALAVVIVVLNVLYIRMVYYIWEADCGAKKVSRSSKSSPSNRQPPDVVPWKKNQESILDAAEDHPDNFGTCELLHPLAESEAPKESRALSAQREKVKRANTMCPGNVGKNMTHALSDAQAEELNMDHVYLSFPDFLWAYYFIAPNSAFLWCRGILLLLVRQFLHRRGWIKPIPQDDAAAVGRLCLEGTLAINYYARTSDGKIAGFFFSNFPVLKNDGSYDVHDLFAVDIDLETKKMVKAKLDDAHLTASEALTLVWFYTIFANHVKLHSLANWGVNVEGAGEDPFIKRNSTVTVMYNYFGYKTFPRLTELWKAVGVVKHTYQGLPELIDHGIKDNIWQHPRIHELMQHSTLVNFIVKTRAVFISEFEKYKKDFAGCNGEAMFVGTILHSLDHTIMNRNLQDPLWLDVDHPEFGAMAELGRIVKVGFVSDVPGLIFHKRYKGAKHPFYAEIYKKAAKFNDDLASNMDTCIIK